MSNIAAVTTEYTDTPGRRAVAIHGNKPGGRCSTPDQPGLLRRNGAQPTDALCSARAESSLSHLA